MAAAGPGDTELSGGALPETVILRGLFYLSGALCIPVEGYTAGELPGLVILRDFVDVGGTPFIALRGTDAALVTYLTGRGTGGRSTAAFEHLGELVRKEKEQELRRIAAYEAEVEEAMGEADTAPALDLGLHEEPSGPTNREIQLLRNPRKWRSIAPTTLAMNVEVGAHVPWPVRCLFMPPRPRSKVVYMEASVQNLKGLKALVVHMGQREKKRRRSPLPYQPSGEKGQRHYFSRRHRGYVQRTVEPSGRVTVVLVDPDTRRKERDASRLEPLGDEISGDETTSPDDASAART